MFSRAQVEQESQSVSLQECLLPLWTLPSPGYSWSLGQNSAIIWLSLFSKELPYPLCNFHLLILTLLLGYQSQFSLLLLESSQISSSLRQNSVAVALRLIVLVLSKTGFIVLTIVRWRFCCLFAVSFFSHRLREILIQGNVLVCVLDSTLKSGLPVSMSSVLFLHSAAFVLKEA